MAQRKHSVLGVELGANRARLAVVSAGGETVELVRTVTWADTGDGASHLRVAIADIAPEVQMAVSLESRHVRSRLVDLPAVLKKCDVDLALASRLRKYLQFRADDWSLFPREAKVAMLDPERRAYFATLVSATDIKTLQHLLEPFAARWTNRQLEVPSRSLQRWLQFERPAIRGGVHAGAHFLEDHVIMWACSEGTLIMSRRLEWAASPATIDDAAVLTGLTSQMRATLAWLRFRTLPCEIAPQDIYLSGQKAALPAIVEAVTRDLGLPVITIDAPRLHPSGAEVAYGLSLIGIDEKG